MSHRRAATLIEVLIAIFIMGIGLIALLTLFPLGAISMAQAIQDERAYQCSVIANGYANALNLRRDAWVLQDWWLNAAMSPPANPNFSYTTGNALGQDPISVLDAYTNPFKNIPLPYANPFPGGTLPDANVNGPSYPLFIDPIGFYSTPPTVKQGSWVGGGTNLVHGVLARRRVSFTPSVPLPNGPYLPGAALPLSLNPPGISGAQKVPNYPQPYPYPPPPPVETTTSLLTRMFTLADDLVYDSTNPGMTALTGPLLLRDTRYSWAFLCQRPQNGPPSPVTPSSGVANRNVTNGSSSIVNLSVVVFNKRPLALGAGLSLPEYIYQYQHNPANPNVPSSGNPTYYDPINNVVTIDYTNYVPPPLRPGDWLLDVTQAWTGTQNPTPPPVTPPYTSGIFTPHAYFYRVVSVNEFTDTIPNYPGVRSLAQYEVQPPLRGFTDSTGIPVFPLYPYAQLPPWNTPGNPPLTPIATTTLGNNYLGYPGTSVVLDGVVRAYEMGPGRTR